MVQKVITSPANVVDFARYQQDRSAAANTFLKSPRVCRYCGAKLSHGEREEECSSAFNIDLSGLRRGPRTFFAD